jgi:hypothetical protein
MNTLHNSSRYTQICTHNYVILRDFRLPPQLRRELCFSWLLRGEYWKFGTDISGQNIGPHVNDSLSRNVGNKLPYSLRNNQEERSYQTHCLTYFGTDI